jgi:hypothetical protein
VEGGVGECKRGDVRSWESLKEEDLRSRLGERSEGREGTEESEKKRIMKHLERSSF